MDRKKLVKKLQTLQGEGTRQQLAKKLKIAPSYLSDIFNGNREPGPELLHKLRLERRVTYVDARP